MNEKGIFVHHVFFWLKNPDSSEDLAQLTEGLRKLTAVNTIRSSHIGKPA
ncbi:MAG: Dabb family protein, partial [Chitinophagaceae bacterium]|nr:Dabb family protein [Chitinophagaceae bacterium]